MRKIFDKNPKRTTGNNSGRGASLLFHAATVLNGFVRLSAFRGFLEAYFKRFEE